MRRRLLKPGLLLLTALALAGSSRMQDRLNRQREDLNLTRMTPLENAPPMLAFSTVALGGFRGLIVNFLWLRANQLQFEGKYFETLTLGDWITKLQPTFAAVWSYHAWNMAYNISRTFEDERERWNWVRSGFQLLRDEGLRYNPTHADMYRELSWTFYDKIGRFSDQTHLAYKRFWAEEMIQLFPTGRPDFARLNQPQTDADRALLTTLRTTYKLDPKWMQHVQETWGPFDWRLPETHAIYWSSLGRERAKEGDLLVLHRGLWQGMQLAFQRGKAIVNPMDGSVEFSPNIEIIPQTNRMYEDIQKLMPDKYDYVSRAHKNFLADAIYFLYTHNRRVDAQKWQDYTRQRYPDTWQINLPLDEFVIARVTEDVGKSSVFKVKSIVEGYMTHYYFYRALDETDLADGHTLMARKIYDAYHKNLPPGAVAGSSLPPYREMQKTVLIAALEGKGRFSPELAARLRLRLGLPEEWRPVVEAMAAAAPEAGPANQR